MEKHCWTCIYDHFLPHDAPCIFCKDYSRWDNKRPQNNNEQEKTTMATEWEKKINPALEGKMEDSGERMEFESGAVREPAKGKGRYDLISPVAIDRVANWDRYEDPIICRALPPLEMAYNHIQQFRLGDRQKDHICAAANYLLNKLNLEPVSVNGAEPKPWTGTKWYGIVNPFVYERLAKWYELGGEKYPARNWEKGMSYSRLLDSAKRHINRFEKGERGEDHLIAALWNIFAYIHYVEMGFEKFDDVPRYFEDGEARILTHFPTSRKKSNAQLNSARQEQWEHDLFNPVFTNPDGTTRPAAIGVDFDGTLCVSLWPGIGKANKWLINHLIEFRKGGGQLVLVTNREGALVESAVAFCKHYGLEFDKVNENLESWTKCFGNDTRKIGCDRIIDDKAVCIRAK